MEEWPESGEFLKSELIQATHIQVNVEEPPKVL